MTTEEVVNGAGVNLPEDIEMDHIPAPPVVEAAAPKLNGYTNIFPGSGEKLSEEITEHLNKIQGIVKMPLWVIMQDGGNSFLSDLAEDLWTQFYSVKNDLKKDEPIAILLVSPGGDAESAYRIAKMINKICGHFIVLAPRQAKSAATLLALGAKEIFIGRDADLGPLDVQITDHNEERSYSALDEVQSIDGLFEFANTQVIQTATYWSRAMKKKKQLLFPSVVEYVTGMMKPLMEKIDTVHYMSLSRTLRIAEEYAVRLLAGQYGTYNAKVIAKQFVENYPYHGFIIDLKESRDIGLKNIKEMSGELQDHCDAVVDLTDDCGNYLVGKFYTEP